MALRIRKLAKELKRTPAEVLGLLHALGYDKYKSQEDMVSDQAVAKVRRADQQGLRPLPIQEEWSQKAPTVATKAQPKDLMSQLVPGVVPQDPKTLVPMPKPLPRDVEVEARRLAGEKEALEALQVNLADLRSSLEAQKERLDEQQAHIVRQKAAMEEDRANLAEEKACLERARLKPTSNDLVALGVPLKELLQKRGLRGSDEFERAFGALADARSLRDIMDLLEVSDIKNVEHRLKSRLILVGGQVPRGLPSNLVAVTVAPDRAEIPDGQKIEREVCRMGEQMMLCGMRRLLVIGGSPLSHRLLHEYLDSRIEVRFPEPEPRTKALAEADVTRVDAIVLWGVEVLDEGREVYGTARAMAIEVPQTADVIECAKLVCAALA